MLRERFADRIITPESSCFGDYAHDATEIDYVPDLVIFPHDTPDITDAVRLARTHRFPLIARGAGTGYSGGAVAINGGVVLSLERMNEIIDIEPVGRTALVQAGVITYDLDRAAGEYGLFYPPDPASYKESTLGGNLAECAGGLRSAKYGVTKDYVLGMEYVDYDGDIRLAGSMNNREEMCDIGSLMIGSEGTLGIVTRIHLRLLSLPEARRTFLYAFRDEVDAAEAVAAVRMSGIIPSVMEFMDSNALESVTAYLGVTDMSHAAAMLLVELDGAEIEVAEDSAVLESIVPLYDPVVSRRTANDGERENLWELRRELSTAVKEYSKIKTSEDVCVPLTRFANLVARIREIGHKYSLRTASFGHAGDGNLHVCFIIPELTDDVIRRMHEAKVDLLRETLSMGGTISGEHGIGFTKKDFLSEEVGEDVIELFRLVKKSFDPQGIINPGKMF